jgi:hypothetical protein
MMIRLFATVAALSAISSALGGTNRPARGRDRIPVHDTVPGPRVNGNEDRRPLLTPRAPCLMFAASIGLERLVHNPMRIEQLQATIDAAWEDRANVGLSTRGPVRDAVDATFDLLDSGKVRVAERKDGAWHVNQWLKKAVLLSFRLHDMATISGGPGGAPWFDKLPSKFKGWDDKAFRAAGFRADQNDVVGEAQVEPALLHRDENLRGAGLARSGNLVDGRGFFGECVAAETVDRVGEIGRPGGIRQGQPEQDQAGGGPKSSTADE